MKIALVELSASHEECMFSQVLFLVEAGHEVTLYVHPKIETEHYKPYITDIVVVDFDTIPKIKSFPLQIKLVHQLKVFDKVIFNTASSSKALRNIVFFLNAYATECIGVIHHVKKLNKSFTQKIISTKIKKYLALSDTLKHKIMLQDQSLALGSFYPIFFPKTKSIELQKKEDDVWICIPGRVFFDRRDYAFLMQYVTQAQLPNNLKFVILGNIKNHDGEKLLQTIEKHQVSNAFLIFDKFIPNNVYYNYLEKSDYVMPLLQKEDCNYLNSKIAGAFNLAFGFGKPLVFHEFYEDIPDLNANGVSYNEYNFEDIMMAIANKSLETPVLYQDKKWTFEYQQQHYINFINK